MEIDEYMIYVFYMKCLSANKNILEGVSESMSAESVGDILPPIYSSPRDPLPGNMRPFHGSHSKARQMEATFAAAS